MRILSCLSLIAGLTVVGVPVFAADKLPQSPYSGRLQAPDGKDLGTVTVTPVAKGVILRLSAKGLTPGWHGMHFHEKGACTDEKFASAGGHVHSAAPVVHGFLNADANDAGDLPNLFVAADGTATTEVYSVLVSATPTDSRPALMDADGSAVVIHAMPDDYVSQPIGGAGARIACAVIQ